MVVAPHDIVKVCQIVQETTMADFPNWAKHAWRLSPFHVVRRAPMISGIVPIGIRGQSRGERLGIDIPKHWVESIFTPQSLVEKKCWKMWQRNNDFPEIIKTLDHLLYKLEDYSWGIGGSLGYELTTNSRVIHKNSDIDLILYQSSVLSYEECVRIIELTTNSSILIDIQVQNKKGSFHLQEYVKSPYTSILLKTFDGPVLTKDIWE